MDPSEKRELKRKAFARLAAQRRRAGLLRGRVVVISLLCFAVLWGVVFAQMVSGHDPGLSAQEATATTRTARTVASASASGGASSKREAEVPTEAETEPLTTRQS